MYFMIRALKYLRKKVGKTIFMGIIFFVIANFVLAGLLIQRASDMAEENTRLSIGSDINYIQDWEGILIDAEKGVLDRRVMGKIKNNDMLSDEDFTLKGAPTVANIKQAVESEYVSSYQINSVVVATGRDYQQVQIDSGASDNGQYQVSLYENNIPEAFISGTASLVEGNMISESDLLSGRGVVMIEKRFSDLNNLIVGDTLTLTYPEVNAASYQIDHEIVGIYTSTEEASQAVVQSGNSSSFVANRFYIPLNIYFSIGYEQDTIDNMIALDNVIRLEDPDNLEVFKESVAGIINMRYGRLDSNDELYESLVGPIQIVGLISNVAVMVILITGGLIIGLITALTVNERRSEVGILLAVGERKSKIVMQFVLEVLIIAIITFSLSIVSGGFIGQAISDSPIASEFIDSDEDQTPQSFSGRKGGFISKKVEVEQPELELSLSLDLVALLFGIGIALAVISTIIPSLYVMRYNPKQILNNKVS